MKKINSHNIEEYIYVPNSLPKDIDKKSFIHQQKMRIQDLQNEGRTLSESLEIVNGKSHARSFPINQKHATNIVLISIILTIAAILVSIMSYKVFVNPSSETQALVEEEKLTGTGKKETILIVGGDERPKNDKGYGTQEDIPGIRTDIIALAMLNEDETQLDVVSFPRDLNVNKPKCDKYNYDKKSYSKDESDEESYDVKINSIVETGGPQCLMSVVENISGQEIDRYVQFNFEDFKHIIDSMGGITITTDGPVVDDILGEIINSPGEHHINGDKALDFVRARHVQGGLMNDFERIERQQKVVDAIFYELKNNDKLKSPSFITSMVTNVLPQLTYENINIFNGAQLVSSISRIPSDQISFYTIPVTDAETWDGNLLYDDITVQDFFEKEVLSDKEMETETIDRFYEEQNM